MQIKINRTLTVVKENSELEAKVGSVLELELKDGTFDVIQIVKINDKSLTVGSYMTPNDNPRYIKFKDIVNVIDILHGEIEEVEPVEETTDGE